MCINLTVAKQRLGRHVTAATNAGNNKIIVDVVVFFTVRVVSKKGNLFLPELLQFIFIKRYKLCDVGCMRILDVGQQIKLYNGFKSLSTLDLIQASLWCYSQLRVMKRQK